MQEQVNEAFELETSKQKPSDEKGTVSKDHKVKNNDVVAGNFDNVDEKNGMSLGRIYKNLIVICIGFLCLFCAFQALGNLQSTLNAEGGLGLTAQSVIYASLILSSLFLPTIVIRRLGVKVALVISMAMYCPYIAAHFYAKFYTMVPAAILVGLGAAPMWSAKCTYLNEIGFRHAKRTGEVVDTVIIRFFGIFFMFFQSSQVWGNLISWMVLDVSESNKTVTEELSCGIDFDREADNSNLGAPPNAKVYTLIGIYFGAGVLAFLLVLFLLDPLERDFGTKDRSNISTDLIKATFNHMKNPEQLILIPLTIFSGLEQAFFLGDFTQAYVACAWGIHKIGYVAICFGVVNAIVSLSSGHLVKLIRRAPIFLIATAANIATCIALLIWKPTGDDSIIPYFVVAGIWGLGDAVWQTQINAFYGVLFKGDEEPAFSNYRLWESLGFVMAFVYGPRIDVLPKIVILLCFLVVGIMGYLYVEIKVLPKKKV